MSRRIQCLRVSVLGGERLLHRVGLYSNTSDEAAVVPTAAAEGGAAAGDGEATGDGAGCNI